MTDYKEIGERIVEAVAHFEEQLRIKTQVGHTSTQAEGGIIEHFAESVIDAEFADTKVDLVSRTFELLKGLADIEEAL